MLFRSEVELGRLKAQRQEARLQTDDEPETEGTETTLGMTVAPTADLDIDGEGLAVLELDRAGVAAEKGISVGDVILSAGGEPVRSFGDLERSIEVAEQAGRENVLLKLRTGENVRFVALPVDQA